MNNTTLTEQEAELFKDILKKLGYSEMPPELKQCLPKAEECISGIEENCERCGGPIHPCLPCEEVALLNGNHVDYEYCRLLEDILEFGRIKKNRTGIDTIGIFGAQAKFNVNMDAFPILTTKKVWFKGIVHELLWFIRGDTNIKYLVDNDVHIWDEWAYKRYLESMKKYAEQTPLHSQSAFIESIKTNDKFAATFGDLGEGTYGGMWRAFPHFKKTYDNHNFGVGDEYAEDCVDQLKKVIDKLKTNPDDRRMIVSAWHPFWVDHCALPPCHCLFHFNTEELTLEERLQIFSKGWNLKAALEQWKIDGVDISNAMDEHCIPKRRLNCLLYQRSCDFPVGIPFNITSYALLTAMVAHCVDMEPGVFTHTYGDAHIYVNQLDGVKEQISRSPKKLPKLWLNPHVKNLFDFKYDDIKLLGYNSHPAIKFPVAV